MDENTEPANAPERIPWLPALRAGDTSAWEPLYAFLRDRILPAITLYPGVNRDDVLTDTASEVWLSVKSLTRRHLFELLPFDNTVVSMSLTGAALAAIARRGIEDPRHRGIDIAGMILFVRRKPDASLMLERIEIAGKPLDTQQEYRVVTSSYLAGGEAGYVEFLTGRERRELPILMRELMEADVKRAGESRPSDEARIVVLPDQ